MKAIMLAAGMGKRLKEYTKNNTKCMLELQGKTLLERTIESLYNAGIKDFVIVLGYKKDGVKEYIKNSKNPIVKKMNISFIDNDIYDKTNNIYSLYLAKEELINDDVILLESDIIYDYDIIKNLVNDKNKNLVVAAKYEQWMDGTVIKINNDGYITEFVEKKDFDFDLVNEYYKTVNIYKFSKEFLKEVFVPFLDGYISAYGNNEYYELVLKVIVHLSRCDLKIFDVSKYSWYEIDNAEDLDIANCMFSSGKEKLELIQKHYGGYWRISSLIDYCYLVNPYFPPKQMLDKFKYFFNELLVNYPSSLKIQNMNAGRVFNINEEYLCVGNGASELINVLGKIFNNKKIYLTSTVFNEYVRCFNSSSFDVFDISNNDYKYSIESIMNAVDNDDVICIVNPDNPTGSFINKDDILKVLDKAKEKNKTVIFDESFIDFTNEKLRYTLLNNDILEKYDNLIVIKSISKSYGVPGLRLGVLATSNKNILSNLKENTAIWNINSFAEYFLQIFNIYEKDYIKSCNKISETRNKFINDLRKIKNIKVYDSEANFVMCEIINYDSTLLAIKLLENNIFIKDLKTKGAFNNRNFVRLAVRSEEENDYLVKILKDILK